MKTLEKQKCIQTIYNLYILHTYTLFNAYVKLLNHSVNYKWLLELES